MAWHDGPKARDHPDVQAYLDDLRPEQRAICNRVRQLVKADPDVVEGIAWGVPFYFRKGPLCYTSAAKTHVTVGMARGMEIDDVSGLLQGTGKSPIRKATVKLRDGLPDAFADWLEQALALDEEGE
ncbi:MAG: DUF1801 domain-containing protein [Thermoplasmatota archaeon]